MTSVIAFALAGVGLLALAAPDQLQRRTTWLAAARLDTEPASMNRSSRSWDLIAQSANRGGVLAVLAGILSATLVAPVLGGITAAVVWVLCRCWRVVSADRVAEHDCRELSAAVAAVAADYTAGATVAAAFSGAASASGRHAVALARAGLVASAGGQPADVLAADPALRSLGVACAVATHSGSSLSEVLAGVQADLASEQTVRRSVAASLTGPRASALLLALLPLVGLGMGVAMGADPVHILVHTPLGLAALGGGVTLDLTGLVWTWRSLSGHRRELARLAGARRRYSTARTRPDRTGAPPRRADRS